MSTNVAITLANLLNVVCLILFVPDSEILVAISIVLILLSVVSYLFEIL
jgi:hypothetical protein